MQLCVQLYDIRCYIVIYCQLKLAHPTETMMQLRLSHCPQPGPWDP